MQKKRDEKEGQRVETVQNALRGHKQGLSCCLNEDCRSSAGSPIQAGFTSAPSRQTGVGYSTVKDTHRSGYDSRITSHEFTSSQDGGPDDGMAIDEGPGPTIDEGRNTVRAASLHTTPLVVSSPVFGIVPSDSEDDVVMPNTKTATNIVLPATPKSVVTGPLVQPTKGPAGITLLPAYQADPAHHPENAANSLASSVPEQKPYPSPPGAHGSQNDRFRQVPRSGGGVRNPNHQPYKYPYGPHNTQLGANALQVAYNQQYNQFPQQNGNLAQNHLPAGAFNQSGYFQNQNYVQTQLYQQSPLALESHSSLRGSYRGRGRGKYDVRKVNSGQQPGQTAHIGNGNNDVATRRGDHSTHGNHYKTRAQYGNGGQYKNTNGKRNVGYGTAQPNSPGFPLDPALEANYRSYTAKSQNNYSNVSNNGQYFAPSHSQGHTQYPASPYFGYGIEPTYSNSYGHGHPLPVNNPNYYTPTAFSHPVQQIHGGPQHNPGPSTIAQQQPSTFHPSPYATEFTPHSMDLRRLLNPEPPQSPPTDNAAAQQNTQHHAPAQQNTQHHAPAQQNTQHHGPAQEAYNNMAFAIVDTDIDLASLSNPISLATAKGQTSLTISAPASTMLPLSSAYLATSSMEGVLYAKAPDPVVRMPPMGQFSPPKARKSAQDAMEVLEKVEVVDGLVKMKDSNVSVKEVGSESEAEADGDVSGTYGKKKNGKRGGNKNKQRRKKSAALAAANEAKEKMKNEADGIVAEDGVEEDERMVEG